MPLAFRRTVLRPEMGAGAAILVAGFVAFGSMTLGLTFVWTAMLLLAAALLGCLERRLAPVD